MQRTSPVGEHKSKRGAGRGLRVTTWCVVGSTGRRECDAKKQLASALCLRMVTHDQGLGNPTQCRHSSGPTGAAGRTPSGNAVKHPLGEAIERLGLAGPFDGQLIDDARNESRARLSNSLTCCAVLKRGAQYSKRGVHATRVAIAYSDALQQDVRRLRAKRACGSSSHNEGALDALPSVLCGGGQKRPTYSREQPQLRSFRELCYSSKHSSREEVDDTSIQSVASCASTVH
mmetsp:Transcript_12211/g.51446  ORF Transcript_12211/g.51446 Transcript_12211/m.51446 type:complete len:231 (-) Transcript_12211:160-852(-)